MLVADNALIKVTPGLMIWTIVCFFITLFVLRRYAFGPIQTMIDERRERIRQSLEEADRAREEARHLLEEHRALIASARQDADEILGEARRIAEAQRERVREEAETRRALDQIRAEVADLTLIAAEKVTRKALDASDQRRLIDEAIRELDFSV